MSDRLTAYAVVATVWALANLWVFLVTALDADAFPDPEAERAFARRAWRRTWLAPAWPVFVVGYALMGISALAQLRHSMREGASER